MIITVINRFNEESMNFDTNETSYSDVSKEIEDARYTTISVISDLNVILERHNFEHIWEIEEIMYDHDIPIEVINDLLKEYDISDIKDKFDDYRGCFDSMKDFAETLVDETIDFSEVPDFLRNYFDYEAYARDLEHDFFCIWDRGQAYIFRQ